MSEFELLPLRTNGETISVSPENPSGRPGMGGVAGGGRKGEPYVSCGAGSETELATLSGPGTLTHIWMTVPPEPPEAMRRWLLEIFYDDHDRPSISVPLLDFFCLPHGRPASVNSAFMSTNDGRGLNSFLAMPFEQSIRIVAVNLDVVAKPVFYQITARTGGTDAASAGYLQAVWRRENPTRLGQDFNALPWTAGPLRLVGMNMGIRVLRHEYFTWYGEGEVKMYTEEGHRNPTICGTGLEDYFGSAWEIGQHSHLYSGCPLVVADSHEGALPRFVSFYRWHCRDPYIFASGLRIDVQQLGYIKVPHGSGFDPEQFARAHPPAGKHWHAVKDIFSHAGVAERTDDVCATVYFYAGQLNFPTRPRLADLISDVERVTGEQPTPIEAFLTSMLRA